MKDISILILLFIILIIFLRNKYYDLYINEPYITVHAKGGLNNKLRVLLSYLYRVNKEGKKLRLFWIKDSYHCPENYENLFEPIDNVEIINNYSKLYDYNTFDEDNKEYIKAGYYKLLKPIKSIQDTIDNYKNKLNNNYIAIHIRRTDSIGHPSFVYKSDEEYMKFIDSLDSKLKIYIATDNKDTQDTFISKYNDRVFAKPIISHKNLRQTSIQDAVVDLYICVNSLHFLGTTGSSFTDTILYLKEN
jgi:hypothetical protein